jgi:hypothetical protein
MTDSKVNVPTQGTVLERTAMLVKLSRHKFNHNTMDKELSKKLVKELKVKGKNIVRVQKTIIPREAIKPWSQILNEAGKYFYTVTIPWDDKSWRLLPVVKYKEFVAKFREFQARFTQAVDEFIMNLDKHIADGRAELGLAANDNDYIDKQKAREQFVLKVEYETLKTGSDFRAQVTEEERDEIAKAITEQNEAKFANAQSSVFARVHDVASKISEKMSEADPEFRDSLVGNVQALVDILPSLNVANDVHLDSLKEALDLHLASLDPQDLRDDHRLRKDTKDKADKIMEQADAFMGKASE